MDELEQLEQGTKASESKHQRENRDFERTKQVKASHNDREIER